MAPTEIRDKSVFSFDEWDKEYQSREQPFIETSDIIQKIREEEAQINRSLDETVAKFDELLNLLDKEHVIVSSGENLNLENKEKIVGLSRIIYEEAMLALHLTRDHDLTQNIKLTKLKDSPELNKYIPIDSLKKKVKSHFILAELYATLGLRTDPNIQDRSERVEYEKVIEEGELLYERYEKQNMVLLSQIESAKDPESSKELYHKLDINNLARIRLAHDMGASNKRLFDLFVQEEKLKEGYGKVKKVQIGETIVEGSGKPEIKKIEFVGLHDYIKNARKWYNEMFDIQNKTNLDFDSHILFHTEYEFNRYIKDIADLSGVGCVFQTYSEIPNPQNKQEPLKYFSCSKDGEECKHNKEAQDNIKECTFTQDTHYYDGLIVRVELMRDL